MSPLWRTPISNYIHLSNITVFGFISTGRRSKINQGTKPNTHQPFKLRLFKAEHLVSPTYYPIRTWMHPGAIMPKNSPIVDINQFSGDFRITHPQDQVHPITPLSNAWPAGVRSRRPSLRPSRWTKRWHISRWTATTSRTLVPRRLGAQGVQKKTGGEGDGPVSGRLTRWRVLGGGVWGWPLGLG